MSKGLVLENPFSVNVWTVPNTAEISTAALASYYSIIVRQIELEPILAMYGRICSNLFKSNYLRHQHFVGNFLLHFWNLQKTLITMKKKMSLVA